MNMQWTQFQETADRLALGSTEGDWRSAMSRSYYSVFHFFREFLVANGLDVGVGGQCHFNLYSGLLNCGFLNVAAIASRIDSLRANRAWADYNLRRSVSQRAAQTSAQEARLLVADFQAALTTLSAVQIVSGARQHLQSIGRLPRNP
jgi:uncharacterized protein (UPF0332 family)